jgi:hypothetical protein
MPFRLTEVVPWGRSFDEYVAMFALSDGDLQSRLLGCADGPASFNCELTRRGGTVVSVDPMYECSAEEVERRIGETFQRVLVQTRRNMHEFVWKHIRSVDDLARIRMDAMRLFLGDYEQGRREGRYLPESLPSLSFSDGQFDLALCSHYLFLYSEHLDLQFHIESIAEMCRVAAEARVFPLLMLGATPSPHLPAVVGHFSKAGYQVDIVEVPYEFQRGGNEMLRVRRTGGVLPNPFRANRE